jgi:hypothetical protein
VKQKGNKQFVHKIPHTVIIFTSCNQKNKKKNVDVKKQQKSKIKTKMG